MGKSFSNRGIALKRILLISYYFEPCQAIGSKRWSELFSLFNNDKDYEITVLTANWEGEKVKQKNVHYIGDSIKFIPFKSINREFTIIDILKHPSTFIRSLDRSILGDQWYLNVKKWIDSNKNNEYDIVISSYTPINSIRLGTYAKKVFNAKYIVDMRDMMSLQGQKIKVPIIEFFDKLLDKFWLKEASFILSVGPTICQKASKFYKKDVHLLYNAFLEKDFIEKNLDKIENKVVLSYMGTMGNKRNPRGLLELLNEYAKQNSNLIVEVNFASQDDPHEFIRDLEINSIKINWLGYLSKEGIASLKIETNCFILLEDMDIKGKENVTGKVFEYMLEQKPVIAYCNQESDIKKILEYSEIGKIITDFDNLKLFMNLIIENQFMVNKNKILEFSREKQYQKLKGLL